MHLPSMSAAGIRRILLLSAVITFALLASNHTARAAGDCDGSGSVTIAEVQQAIRMFLGLEPVLPCVDQDNSTTVSVAEVQKTINSFLDTPPPDTGSIRVTW